MNFKQAMIVPTMVSLGIGTLLFAKNLQLMEVSYAAPAAPAAPGAPGAPGAGGAAASGRTGPGALPALPQGSVGSAEFPGRGAAPAVVKAIRIDELAHKALEASGREDPFMALLPPEASQIAPPPVTFAPLNPIPAIEPAGPPKAPGAPADGKGAPTPPKVEDLPFAGDKAPAVGEPQWLIRGIMSTGTERVVLLEGKDDSIHARVGDVLSDGSKVTAITSRGVTFMRSGRRFVKQIGGSN